MKDPNKHLFKGLIIIILIALLLLPTLFISNLVKERKTRKEEITKSVNSTWAGQQILSSPFLQLPYTKNNSTDAQTYKAYVMANSFTVETDMEPQNFYRGIYKIPVYTATLEMKGNFAKKDLDDFTAGYGPIQFANANLVLQISDVKGIIDSVTAMINNKPCTMLVNGNMGSPGFKTLTVPVSALITQTMDFSYSIRLLLKGTEKISFLPLAAMNAIHIRSGWADPSFEGSFATNTKTISRKGFDANWKITKYQTSVPSISNNWPPSTENLVAVNLINPVDAYAKTLRCTKYALLFIALTFAIFYFIEVLKNAQIHPVQYTLIGLAIVIFFTLLLSISEYLGFDMAYLISAVAILLLITSYAKSVMHSTKNAVTVALVLTALYIFLYILIQLEEAALLVGSIGLFVILAILMQVSRKINWNGFRLSNNPQ
jgi:inner membrane protein